MAGKRGRPSRQTALSEPLDVPEYTPKASFLPDPMALINYPRIRRGFGQGSGARPMYEKAEDLEKAINAYFKEVVETQKHPTIAGLALAVGFRSRQTLLNYIDRGEDFAAVIEGALTCMEDYKNQMLLNADKTAHNLAFDLKNAHGWKDRHETVAKIEAGNSLADLLQSLQGNVLRPKLEHDPNSIEDAEYYIVEEPKRNPDDDIPEDVRGLF